MRRIAPLLLAIAIAGCGDHPSAESGTVWRLDPHSGLIEGKTRAPGRPCRLAADSGGVWATDLSSGAVYRGAHRLASLPGERPCGVAPAGRSAWVGTASGRVVRVPGRRGVDTGARAGIGDLTVYRGAVWAADLAGSVLRVDGGVRRIRGIGETEQVTPLDGAIWAIAAGPGQLVRIDARTLRVRRFRIGPSPKAVAAGDGSVWVALTDRRLLRFDPRRARASLVARLPDAPILLAPGGGVVWSLAANGRLTRVDEATRTVQVANAFRRPPFGLALAPGVLWVGTR